MENQNLSPEKSLDIINQVISEAKQKFEDRSFIYVYWGIIISLAAFAQFILLQLEQYSINYYPYFIMPVAAIYNFFYFAKKSKGKSNQINKILSYSWISISLNLMILAFAFPNELKQNLVPILLVLVGIGIIISGSAIRSKIILYAGIFINICALTCFKLTWEYHSLLMGCVAIIAILIPGLILYIRNRKEKNV